MAGKDKVLEDILLNSEVPPKYNYQTNFTFTEYNKVKYELLKYSNAIIKDIFDIYDIFMTLYKYNDLRELSRNEYLKVRDLFLLEERIKGYIEKECGV